MELTGLKNNIVASFKGAKKDLETVIAMLEEDQAVFPFNEYEHLICNLINKGGLSYEQYIEIRAEYISEQCCPTNNHANKIGNWSIAIGSILGFPFKILRTPFVENSASASSRLILPMERSI